MRLLMLDLDPRLVSAVTRTLDQHGFEVVGVQSVDGAREVVATEHLDAAVLDCDLFDAGALTDFSRVPVILTTSFLESEGRHWSFQHARLLRKPFTSAQLLSLLHDACGTPCSHSIMLVDVLRRAHSDGLNVTLRVGEADIFMEAGELVHAELDGLSGESALARVLSGSQREPFAIPVRATVRTIHRPFQGLLLDLLRNLEERENETTKVTRPRAKPLGKDPLP